MRRGPGAGWIEAVLGDPVAEGDPATHWTRDAEVRPTICGLCSCGCGMRARLGGDRLYLLEGDPGHPVNEGTLCARGAAAAGLHDHPGRLRRPRRRRAGSGRWEDVSWEEALREVARRLFELRDLRWDGASGRSDSLAFLGGAEGTDEEAYLLGKLARLLGVVGVDGPARLGYASFLAAMGSTFGEPVPTRPLTDLDEAGMVLVAGDDPAEGHPMTMRWVLRARERGAGVVVVDPRHTDTAAHAEEHLALRPGTDAALAGGLAHVLLREGWYDAGALARDTDAAYLVSPDYDPDASETAPPRPRGRGADHERAGWRYQRDEEGRPLVAHSPEAEGTVLWHLRRHLEGYTPRVVADVTGVDSEQVERLARRLHEEGPVAIMLGRGVFQHPGGVQQARAYAVLQVLLGGSRVAGGGLRADAGAANARGACRLGARWDRLPGELPLPGEWERDLGQYRTAHGRRAAGGLERLLAAWFPGVAGAEEAYRFLPRWAAGAPRSLAHLLDAMREGEIKGLVTVGQDLLATCPDEALTLRALASLRTLVVVDLFETGTAGFWQLSERAEEVDTEVWVLPAAGFFEKAGGRTRADGTRQWSEALVPPPGAARSDLQILDGLHRELVRLGRERGRPRDRPLVESLPGGAPALTAASARDEIERVLGPSEDQGGGPPPVERFFAGDHEVLAEGELLERRGALADGPLPCHREPVEGGFENPLATVADGASRVVYPRTSDHLAPGAAEQFPHLLVTGELQGRRRGGHQVGSEPCLQMSNSLASNLGVRPGERVRVGTLRGSVVLRVDVTDRLRSLMCGGSTLELVWAPLGFGALGVPDAPSLVRLTMDPLDPSSHVPGSKVCRCRIQRLSDRGGGHA